MDIPDDIQFILNQNNAYLINDPIIGLIVFAKAKDRPCKSAPPRRYWIDKYAVDMDDFVIWTMKYGKTVNLSRSAK